MKMTDILMESLDIENLYWFMYHPKTKQLHHVDGTHTNAIVYDLHLFPQADSQLDLEDSDILDAAFHQDWVRGRYGEFEGSGWSPMDGHDLSLQGKPKLVRQAAKDLIDSGLFVENLYVDFSSNTEMESHHLKSDQIDLFLKYGKVP